MREKSWGAVYTLVYAFLEVKHKFLKQQRQYCIFLITLFLELVFWNHKYVYVSLKCNGIFFDNFLKQVNNTIIKGNFMIQVKTIIKQVILGSL